MQSHTKKPDHNIRANDMDITGNVEAFTIYHLPTQTQIKHFCFYTN